MDASATAIGAVLTQLNEKEQEVVIAYGSQALTKTEWNYNTTNQECLAIVHFIQEYQLYLLGKRFTVVTDHQALAWLSRQKEPSSRLARYQMLLQEYDFDIKYCSSCEHSNADALSQIPEIVDRHD